MYVEDFFLEYCTYCSTLKILLRFCSKLIDLVRFSDHYVLLTTELPNSYFRHAGTLLTCTYVEWNILYSMVDAAKILSAAENYIVC